MNRYRNYMDRITAPASLHEKLLAGETPRRRRNRYAPAFALAAACCLLAVVGLWQPWRETFSQNVSPTAGVASTPASTQYEQEHTLYVEDPFQGQPHGFFNVTGLAFPDCTNSEAIMVDYGPAEGWFMEQMTDQDIITTLGGEEEVPWVLCWTGFGLDGQVIYLEAVSYTHLFRSTAQGAAQSEISSGREMACLLPNPPLDLPL